MTPEPITIKNDRLYMALELSNKKWKIGFGNGFKIRIKTIDARDLQSLEDEVEKAKKHFRMAEDVPIYSCYEAGRGRILDHRYLISKGIANIVVDPSSIEVNRRARRAKTDRVDVGKLLTMLIRYLGGESKLWSVLHIPDPDQEDNRRLNREIQRLKHERNSHTNRIKSLLALHGIMMAIGARFLDNLKEVRLWNGQSLPSGIKEEIIHEYKRYMLGQEQLKELQAKKQNLLADDGPQVQKIKKLQEPNLSDSDL